MKNIEIRHIKRKAEIAEEFNTVFHAAIFFDEAGIKISKPVSYYEDQLKNYLNSFPKNYMTNKNIEDLKKIRKSLLPLTISSARSLVDSILMYSSDMSNVSHIDLLNYNKVGLKEGVTQKSDICVKLFNNNEEIVTKHFSLKQYEQYSDPQVASGTYLSTIAGLGFEPEGRGSFIRPDGTTFTSKNHGDLKKAFGKYYGTQAELLIDELLTITKEAHKLRTITRRPANLNEMRKKIGNSAVQPFRSLLEIIEKQDPVVFKNRFLKRSGLLVNPAKEMIYTALKSKKPVTFNTITDKVFGSFLKSINQKTVDTKIVRSGANQDGQGVSILFCDGDKIILTADVPLTININGAWANVDRWCKISKMHVKKDHIRPVKAKQLDTSTNCYVKLKAPVFNRILKQRSKK